MIHNYRRSGQEGPKSGQTGRSVVLDYDPDADKWTKVGEMAKARSYHGMSLVPAKTADYCV